MRNLIENKAAATDVVTHDVTPLTVDTDSRVYSRLGWLVVLVGVFGFLLWAMLAPLDKGVPMPGTVVKEGNRKSVQHQLGGTIDEILVKDGDVVKAGQVLVRMNQVAASSQAETTRGQYFTARAMEARLLAERDGLASVGFPPALAAYKDDARATAVFGLQGQLFSSRRMALQSELGAVDENIAGLKLQVKGLQEARDSKQVQQTILKEQLDSMRELAKEGYVARSRLLDLERSYVQLGGAMAEDNGNIGRAQRQILEQGLRRMQRQQEVQKEVRGQLSDSQREAEALASRLQALDFELSNVTVKAPVDGVVVGISVFTKGGVVGSGAKMMEIVPSGDPFVVEGQLPVNLIDRVHNGLQAELVFSAFNSNRTPHIPGVVTQVAADRTVDERTGQPYYKVRATVSPEGAKLIAQHKLDIQPGMPVELFVKTGERTMMSYLLKPVFDRAKSSMTED
ncbi:HlyD family type I secretion periplasmic adaptor subunit [Rugamonas sp. CCM 8940]|uniref:HlyD family type I secretion periplasmic adaptor subunit n=1 Tax=Rugamonas sp. CCM 8940 TaxID=2765359 RepID=UPI0018F54A10|nr:HlyD family type I secretion periplasmic adaptor subunit [Rugamonas sp. CCM 8940]MBJ7313300.1 HlyD family type I secretion periplasmic adaptor subunit [Rugamonas sp. CCM 8940]